MQQEAAHTHVSIDHPDGSPLSPDDPRVTYLRAAVTARAVIGAVRPDHVERRTPCSEWNVGDLVRHMVAVYQRVAIAPTGADLSGDPWIPDIAIDAADDAIAATMVETHQNWEDPARLEAIIEAPWGPTPGGMCLGIWASELYVHAWDLAVSIGVTVDWPEPDVSIAADMTRAGVPEERSEEVPFDPVVAVADDAPGIERLVTWLGRNPAQPIAT